MDRQDPPLAPAERRWFNPVLPWERSAVDEEAELYCTEESRDPSIPCGLELPCPKHS